MLHAALELGEGVLLVTVVHHQHIPVYVEVHVSFVQSEEGGGTFHGSHDARCICGTLHQDFAGAEQQVELAAKLCLGNLLALAVVMVVATLTGSLLFTVG